MHGELGRRLDGMRGAARAHEHEQQILHGVHQDGHGTRHRTEVGEGAQPLGEA
jgi:hypothetical protein